MLVGAAVYLWPNLQGSIPKFAIKKPKLPLLLEHMTVIWYSGCDTMFDTLKNTSHVPDAETPLYYFVQFWAGIILR